MKVELSLNEGRAHFNCTGVRVDQSGCRSDPRDKIPTDMALAVIYPALVNSSHCDSHLYDARVGTFATGVCKVVHSLTHKKT